MTVSGNGQSCPNCGSARGPDDIFCESCGVDFLTGAAPPPPDPGRTPYNLAPPSAPPAPDVSRSAPTQRAPWAAPDSAASAPSAPAPSAQTPPPPSAQTPPTPSAQTPPAPSVQTPPTPSAQTPPPPSVQTPPTPSVQTPSSAQTPPAPSVQTAPPPSAQTAPPAPAAEVPPGQVPVIPIPPAPPRVRFEISVDRAYFDVAVAEGELAFPDPPAPPREVDRTGSELHIGRTSESRNIHPDIDVADLTGDPAVSSRQAVIRVTSDGRLTVTDVGSTNGTVVGAVDSPAIPVNVELTIPEGSPVYVGAWTRLVIRRVP